VAIARFVVVEREAEFPDQDIAVVAMLSRSGGCAIVAVADRKRRLNTVVRLPLSPRDD